MNFSDLRWRFSQAPPRLRVLIRWSLHLILTPVYTAPVQLIIGESAPTLHEHLWPLLLWSLATGLLMGLLFATVGMLCSRLFPPEARTAALISRVHDTRYTRFYPPILLLDAVGTLVLQLTLPNGPFLTGYSGGLVLNFVITCALCGGGFLRVLLDELPPPRTSRAKSHARALRLRGRLTPL